MTTTVEDALSRMYDPEWERLILANAMRRTDDAPARITSELSSDDFTGNINRRIFGVLQELVLKGAQPTMSAALNYLNQRNELAVVGGVTGIVDICENNYVDLMDMDGSIRILRGKTLDREAYGLSVKLQEQCTRGYTVATDEIRESQERLARLEGSLATRKTEDTIGSTLCAVGGLDTLLAKPKGIISSPWPQFNRYTNGGFKPGELVLFAARPSVGKSLAALQVSHHVASYEKKVRFYSLEMTRESQLLRLIANIATVPHDDLIGGNLDVDQRQRVAATMRRIGEYPLTIIDSIFTFSEIMSDISRHKPDFVVIDYLGLIETSGHFDNRNQEISYVSRRLKTCAAQRKIPMLALSQLNRASDIEQRPPQLSDLRESGSLEQDSDVVVMLHQPSSLRKGGDAPKDQIQMLIKKQRNGARDLCVCLTMQGVFCRMIEPAREGYQIA